MSQSDLERRIRQLQKIAREKQLDFDLWELEVSEEEEESK